jgi:hypothetical protein
MRRQCSRQPLLAVAPLTLASRATISCVASGFARLISAHC